MRSCRSCPGPFVAGLLCLAATAAHANGRLPGATGLAIHPSDEHQLLLGLTYGLALSRDGGASWTWMCEQHIEGNGGDVDPSIVVTDDGTLVVLSLTNGGVLVSRDDGCSFERAMGPLQGNRGVDLTLDPSRSGRVLALMSTIVEVLDAGYPRFRNLLAHSLDHGRSWQVLAELPDDMWPETVEVADAEPDRIYISGTASADPLQGIVERSDDGGLSWTRTTVQLPHGSGSLYLSGIHPEHGRSGELRAGGRYAGRHARLCRVARRGSRCLRWTARRVVRGPFGCERGSVEDLRPAGDLSALAPTRSASGCAITFHPGVRTPWWLPAVLMYAGWMRRPRSSRS